MTPRHGKTFKADRLGRINTVSIGRLKVAHVDDSVLLNSSSLGVNPARFSDDSSVSGQRLQLHLPAATANEDSV